MNPIEVLHNAARSYCLDRSRLWSEQLSRLAAEGRVTKRLPDGGWAYTDDVFPRRNVNLAILHEIERFVPGDFRSMDECRTFLTLAGETAQNAFTKPHPATEAAIRDERELFSRFISNANPDEPAKIPLLPFDGYLYRGWDISACNS